MAERLLPFSEYLSRILCILQVLPVFLAPQLPHLLVTVASAVHPEARAAILGQVTQFTEEELDPELPLSVPPAVGCAHGSYQSEYTRTTTAAAFGRQLEVWQAPYEQWSNQPCKGIEQHLLWLRDALLEHPDTLIRQTAYRESVGMAASAPLVALAIVDSGLGAGRAGSSEISPETIDPRSFSLVGDDFPDTTGHGTILAHHAAAHEAIGETVGPYLGSVLITQLTNGEFYNLTPATEILESLAQMSRDSGTRMVVNLSWATAPGKTFESLNQRILPLTDTLLLVAGTGNDGAAQAGWPANFLPVLAVGAIDTSDSPARFPSFSNRGADFLAPGVSLTVVNKDGELTQSTGTSDATAIASAVAGFIWALDPALSPQEVEQIMQECSLQSSEGSVLLWPVVLQQLAARYAPDLYAQLQEADQEHLFLPLLFR